MTKKRQSTLELRASTLALAAGFALSALPFAAQAAGLGRVTVFSALGQPLRAEVELSATREELTSMKASLASPESFKAAGLDYPPALAGLRFVIDRRANGEPVIRLESDRPINDPFVDMLVELNWASGRLVREYTFLLDPPELAAKAAASVAAPAASLPAPAAAEAAPPRPAVPEKAPPPAAEPAATHEVKRGDTLRKIAAANQHAGVSLEQMLVGLYRANREAFDGNNMNRLQSGRILTVPERAAVESVSESEARREVAVQAADWNAYRRRLAAAAAQAPASGDAAGQAAAGRITPKVEEKSAPAAASRDQVRVSKTEAGEDALLARDKALKEANERLAVLERNVSELQKLLEMKNQSLAEMQKQAGGPAAAETAPAPAAAPQAPAKPAEAGPAEAPKVAEKAAEDAKPAEPPKAAETRPKPPAPPKPKVVPPPPPEEPGLVETLLEDPKLPAAAGGILALLLAYIVARRRRTAAEAAPATGTSGFTQTSLGENSVFRNTGGQSVDTSQTPPQTDFSQAGPGTIDTDEVDPVAEADVYMAYGRDAQAEEILLEAKAKDPGRHAIHLKLLEIYAGRQNTAQFEALATELYGDTGGAGADWEKAAAMGRKLDPKNPLYGGDASPAKVADAAEAAPVVAASALAAAALAAQTDDAAEPEPPAAAAGFDEAPADDVPALDFDLGPVAAPEPVEAPPAADFAVPEAEPADAPQALADVDSALDFDLDTTDSAPAAAAEEEIGDLAFDLPEIRIEPTPAAAPVDAPGAGFDDEAPAAPAAAETPEEAPPADEGLDFEFDLATAPETPAEAPTPPFDMRSISLDLDELPPPDAAALDPEATVVDFDATVVDFKLPPEPAADLPAADREPEVAEPEPAALELPAFDADFSEPASLPEIGPIDDLAPEPEAFAPSVDLAEEPSIDLLEGSEEAATKLDLAKAYEEMGDLEGARELLQEVIAEGSAEQRATAQASLERIGS